MKENVRDIIEMYPDVADVEVYREYVGNRAREFHTDSIKFVDGTVTGLNESTLDLYVLDYRIMDEEDYHNSVEANSCNETDFEDVYGDKEAMVLVILAEASVK